MDLVIDRARVFFLQTPQTVLLLTTDSHNEVKPMTRVIFEEIKQISAEMKAIAYQAERARRNTNREEQNILDQLSADREELLVDIFFHGYNSKH
jgi:hypothetical protein